MTFGAKGTHPGLKAWPSRLASGAGLLWCALVLVVHWAAGAFACGWDTSYCAQTHEKNGVYEGTLTARDGGVLANTEFTVSFESRRHEHWREVRGFSTDAQGRFCIRWAEERIVPFVHADGVEIGVDDPWRDLGGAPAPSGCQSGDRGIPWNRADDLTRSFRYVSAFLATIVGMVLLLLGLIVAPRAARIRQLGLGMAAVSTLLVLLLWFV